MKIIISEDQSLFLKRRLSLIDEFVEYALYNSEIFDERAPLSEYVEEVCWMVYDLFDEHGYDIDSHTEDLFEFIKEVYGDKIQSRYYKLQGDVVNDNPDFDDE